MNNNLFEVGDFIELTDRVRFIYDIKDDYAIIDRIDTDGNSLSCSVGLNNRNNIPLDNIRYNYRMPIKGVVKYGKQPTKK